MPRTPPRLKALFAEGMDGDEGPVERSLAERIVDASFLVSLDDAVHGTATEEDERANDRVARERSAFIEGLTKDRNSIDKASCGAAQKLHLCADRSAREDLERAIGQNERRVKQNSLRAFEVVAGGDRVDGIVAAVTIEWTGGRS